MVYKDCFLSNFWQLVEVGEIGSCIRYCTSEPFIHHSCYKKGQYQQIDISTCLLAFPIEAVISLPLYHQPDQTITLHRLICCWLGYGSTWRYILRHPSAYVSKKKYRTRKHPALKIHICERARWVRTTKNPTPTAWLILMNSFLSGSATCQLLIPSLFKPLFCDRIVAR